MLKDHRVDAFLDFLKFASISTKSEHAGDLAACAQWLVEKFLQIGLQVELCATGGNPVVLARTPHRAGLRTLLIYGHYDVQPVDPLDLWTSPPFQPEIREGIVFARGSTDNKGQILAHILGVEALLQKHGELPLNVIFLIEGEEEIGSPNLAAFLDEQKAALACDLVAVSDTGMVARGVPTLTYGLRGIAALEIKLTGPAMDLHSGIYGGMVINPATALVRLLATLHEESWRVAVPGFYDGVNPVAPWEKEAWAELPLTDEFFMDLTGVPALGGEKGYSSLERCWARPTIEINGIGSGYQGEGTKTVLPREAMAKLTFRLVPGQDPDHVMRKVVEHLEQHKPPQVMMELQPGHTGKPYLTDPNSPNGMAARRALAKAFGAEVALIREGGSIPIVQTFREKLNADTLLLGLALPDCRAHSPNENFPLENFFAGIELNQLLIQELAGIDG